MKQYLSLTALLLSVAAFADIPWPSDFWDQVERHRQTVAPKGTQIGDSAGIDFEAGGCTQAWQDGIGTQEVPFDALTMTWLESNAVERFSSFPPTGFLLFFR